MLGPQASSLGSPHRGRGPGVRLRDDFVSLHSVKQSVLISLAGLVHV